MKRWLVVMSAMAQMACCIARGSKVKTPRGERPIEDLVVGDEVVVVDPQTFEEHVAKISAVKSAKRECSLINSLKLTSAHPLFDTNRNEWAPAGDWILGARTEFATVNGPRRVVNVERFVGINEVFDLSIDHPLHTFVADGVIVHNKERIQPPNSICFDSNGASSFPGQQCACPVGSGVTVCSNSIATCTCDAAPVSTVPTVYSSQWFILGDSERALLGPDAGRSRLRCGPSPRGLTVVGSETVNWFKNESVVATRGSEPCFIDVDLEVPESGSTWGQLWFVTRSFQSTAPSVLRIDDVVLLSLANDRAWFEPSRDGDGGLAPVWASWQSIGEWQRYEWQLEFLSPTTYRFWPRLRLSGSTVFGASAFITWFPDGGSTSLADWYDAGNVFSFANEADGGVRVVSFGQEIGGSGIHAASFKLSNDGWLAGPEE